ncbi:MAG: radical SAM protein [Candidatus Riflebacteria bacterium]
MKKFFPDTSIPKTAVLELTSRCNHACIFCSTPWDSDSPEKDKFDCANELSTDQWRDCIDFLCSRNIYGFAFTGGEPFLRKDIFELIEHARRKTAIHPEFDELGKIARFVEKPVGLTLISNGSMFNAEIAEKLKGRVDTVVISLPGLKTFEKLTGGGDPKLALNAIKVLAEIEIPVVVSICVSTLNLPELFENISAGFLAGADQLLLNRFLPGGRGTIHQELCLNKDQIKQMLKIADEVCCAANRYGSVGTELPLCLCEEPLKMLTVGTQCSGGVEFFAVAPDGSVRPCNHSPVNLGHYRDIEKAIASEYWQKFKTRSYLPQMCQQCPKSLRCDGGCREAAHIVGGELDSADPVFNCDFSGDQDA